MKTKRTKARKTPKIKTAEEAFDVAIGVVVGLEAAALERILVLHRAGASALLSPTVKLQADILRQVRERISDARERFMK